MTSRQHQDWINHGKPDSGLALPLQLVANHLSAAGYTVYVYPNDAHLDAEPPEDHTYYSETGWPLLSPKWWRHAIDIMPDPNLPSLQVIGQRFFDARQAGNITWLKYMNWPSTGNLSFAVQDRWEPNHTRGSSSDTGHIHLSSTTGCEVLDDDFNPLTNVIVAGTTTGVTDVNLTDIVVNTKSAATTGNRSVGQVLGDLENLRSIMMGELPVPAGTPLAALLAASKAAVALSADQVTALAAQVTAGVVAAHHGLDDADKPVIEAAVVDALKKGIQ
jgi:hypothetical protein